MFGGRFGVLGGRVRVRRLLGGVVVACLVAGGFSVGVIPPSANAESSDAGVSADVGVAGSEALVDADARHAADLALAVSRDVVVDQRLPYRGVTPWNSDTRSGASVPAVDVPAPDSPRVDALLSPAVPAPKVLSGFDVERSVEVVGERSTNRIVYANPDGTQTVELSTDAVNFQDAGGVWQRVDNRVVRGVDGVLTNTANRWRVRFEPMVPGRGVSVTAPNGMVRFWAEGGRVQPALGRCCLLAWKTWTLGGVRQRLTCGGAKG